MARRPPSYSPPLRRPHGYIDLPPALLIACEGATEERLLNALRAHWKIAQARVKVMGQKGVPMSVVEAALAEQRKHAPRPEVWVAFDRDEHHSWSAAIDRALALGFRLAVSNPCIELWGLLLHQDHHAPLDRHAAQRALAQVHAGYHHDRHPYLDVDVVLARLGEAARRCAALDHRAREAGDPRGNPTTSFSALIDRLQTLAP